MAEGRATGVDKMTVDQIPGYLKRHWPKIRENLLNRSYMPSPVRRKEIPKPGGGVRLLGIPTVLDRLIQQAIAQVFQQIWDPLGFNHLFEFKFRVLAGKIPAKSDLQGQASSGFRVWIYR